MEHKTDAEIPSEELRELSDDERGSSRAQHWALMVLYAFLALIALWVVHDFLPSVLWAGVLAIALWPAMTRLQSVPGFRNRPKLVAATLSVAIVVVSVVPLVVGVAQVSGEVHTLFGQAQALQQNGIPQPGWLAKLPFGAQQASTWWQENLAAGGASGSALLAKIPHGSMAAYGGVVGRHVAHALIVYSFMLLALFFIFAEGLTLREQLLRGLGRAFGKEGANLASRMAVSVRGTVSGLVLVGLGEGFLLGLAFFFTGVPHAILLGSVAAIAAMLPLCATILLTLVALWLVIKGSMGLAIVLWVIGFAMVFIAEHFVRPALIGGASRLPFVLVLFGILGGAETLGLLGLFIGPALMTIVVVLWHHFTDSRIAPAHRSSHSNTSQKL